MREKKGFARKTLEKLETKVLAAEGRASMRRKVAAVSKVTKKAARAAGIAAGFAAAAVVLKEVRKRRKV